MSKGNRYLTGFLLVLIGILIGGIFVMMQQGQFVLDRSPVQFTEVKRSEEPIFSNKDLEKLDDRFLFKNVADHVIPTVVYISTVVSLDDYENDESEPDFWDRFRNRRARTVGSGVIISENGYIITNNHVIDGAIDEGISVILNDKRMFEARIVGTDPMTDLAVLKIDAKKLPAITVGNSNKVSVGEWVLAIGNPFRLRSTVTAGIVSALSRQVQISGEVDSQLRIDSYIQTDAAINKGNSGGALVNTSGELVGINTAIATQSGSYQGYGFAVPSNLVGKVMSDIIEFGEVHRALLGVSILGIDFTRAQELGLNSVKGVEIRDVTQGGAAQRQGIQQHDVILSVDDEPVNEPNELQEKIAVHRPGDTVQLKIWRNENVLSQEVELGRMESSRQTLARQEEQQQPQENEERYENRSEQGISFGRFSLGFKVMALSTPANKDVDDIIISGIISGSEADQQGLKEGYVIKKINGETVHTLEELENKISTSDSESLIIEVETPEGATGFYDLKK